MQVRNCPDCQGRGKRREECCSCNGTALESCESCYDYLQSDDCNHDNIVDFYPPGSDQRGFRYKYCRKCNGVGMMTCTYCFGNFESCSSCDGSGQVTFEDYDLILADNQKARQAEREIRRKEEEDKALRDAEAAKRYAEGLPDRLAAQKKSERKEKVWNSVHIIYAAPIIGFLLSLVVAVLVIVLQLLVTGLIMGIAVAINPELSSFRNSLDKFFSSLPFWPFIIGCGVGAIGLVRAFWFGFKAD